MKKTLGYTLFTILLICFVLWTNFIYREQQMDKLANKIESKTEIDIVEAIYHDYLVMDCADGNIYLLEESNKLWYNLDGSVMYEDGKVYNVVVVNEKIVAVFE